MNDASYRHRRVGYAGSGFVFHFVRCRDKETLRKYTRDVVKAPFQPWFADSAKAEKIPEAYSVSIQVRVLPGTITEAVGDFVCESWILVVKQDDARTERRHWNHECGHVCDWARNGFGPATQAAVIVHQGGPGTANWYLGFTQRAQEFAGYCNELLCEAAESMVSGSETPVESGFPFLMPWLSKEGV